MTEIIDAPDLAKNVCPNGCDLRGAPIPQEYIDQGIYPEGVTHYSEIVGVEIRGVYDGIAYWHCPKCGINWHRWPTGHYLRTRLEQYLAAKEGVDGMLAEVVAFDKRLKKGYR